VSTSSTVGLSGLCVYKLMQNDFVLRWVDCVNGLTSTVAKYNVLCYVGLLHVIYRMLLADEKFNKNLAIANRSRVMGCAHNTLRASIGINITP